MIYDEKLIEELRKYFLDKELTLSIAESVTGGHLQAACSAASEARLFFHGGITAYNLGQKSRHLNVEPIHAECNDCVSEQVAREMAINVNSMFLSNIGISITGYATPIPEKKITDIYAWFCVAKGNDILLCERITSSKKGGVEVQVDYAMQVIEKTLKLLNG